MPGHSPQDVKTAAVADLSTALHTLSTDESTLLRDAPAGLASTLLSATIQLLRDMFHPTDTTPLANTLNVPACQFPPTGSRRPIRAAHRCRRALRASSKGDRRPTPGPRRALVTPTHMSAYPGCPGGQWTPIGTNAALNNLAQDERVLDRGGATAHNRTATNYLHHVNKAIDGTCRITAVEHDTSATSCTLVYLVRSNTGSEYRIPCLSLLRK
jgi:hypothetical protein